MFSAMKDGIVVYIALAFYIPCLRVLGTILLNE